MLKKNEKVIVIRQLAHHNPERDDFNNHIFYLFNYAFCIGCFSFLFGVIIALITANLFYFYIVRFISFPIVLAMFLICWIPSIFQYSIQIMTKKPLKNRAIKFLIRFLIQWVVSFLYLNHQYGVFFLRFLRVMRLS